MSTVTSTSSKESVKCFLDLVQNRQESIIKPIEEYYHFLKQGTGALIESEALSIPTLFYLDWVGLIICRFTSRGSANVTAQIEGVLNQLHQDWVIISKPVEIRDYLLRHPDITDLLPFVCRIARERFGMYTQLSLEIYHDPEIEDEYLTLYVRQEHYDEDVLDTIEGICTQYEGKLAGKSGWLLVTTDFRPPK